MPVTEIRPLSLGELLDRTFNYYRSHFRVFVGIMAIPHVFALGSMVLLIQVLREAPKYQSHLLAGLFVMTIPYGLAYPVALGATTFALSRLYLGQDATVRSAYRSIQGSVWRLVKLFVVTLLLVLSPFFALGIVPLHFLPELYLTLVVLAVPLATWLILRYGVAVPALLLENLGARRALKRSAVLTKGYKGRLFAIGFLMALIAWSAAKVLEVPFGGGLELPFWAAALKGQISAWLVVARLLAASVSWALTAPLLPIGLALAYCDARVRKEGFDLQLMMAHMGDAGSVVRPWERAEDTLGGGMLMTTELRALSLRELLDRTFSYYRSRFRVFVGIMVIPHVFLLGVNLLVLAIREAKLPRLSGGIFVGAVLAGLCIMVIAWGAAYAVALGATTFALSRLYLNQDTTIGSAYRSMRESVWRLVKLLAVTSLWVLSPFFALGIMIVLWHFLRGLHPTLSVLAVPLAILRALLVLFLLAVPLTIWLTLLRYGVAVPSLLLENLGVRRALKRSAVLTKSYKGRLVLLGLLMTLIVAMTELATGVILVSNGQISAWKVVARLLTGSVSGALKDLTCRP
ncbi:MAG: hypothetical protein DMG26_14940 [Acidobacteria bacterium]|nr:MAG: hypothetical protein DMG26_14940 [Acidobacteriota bacterium]